MRQPWLHDLVTSLKAPTAVLSEPSGQLRADGAQGVLHADVRVLSQAVVVLDREEPTPIGGGLVSAQVARFSSIARGLGDRGPDPTVRLDRTRSVNAGSVHEHLVVSSTAAEHVSSWLELHLASDLARVEQIKSGTPGTPVPLPAEENEDGVVVHWSDIDVQVTLSAPGASLASAPRTTGLVLGWPVELAPGTSQSFEWTLTAKSSSAPVVGVEQMPWHQPKVVADDPRLSALLDQSFTDLAALRMAPADAPSQIFLAAGSPWYFTLFGRDSLWAARLLLPFGTELARGTLLTLAARQGSKVDRRTGEEPGKIPHELRTVEAVHEGGHSRDARMTLPPLYYGTIDATPLWICLLHDAWRWGLPDDKVKQLLPALHSALEWLRRYADPDRDGFLEYLSDAHGLANQGWKDSGDSIRFADGRIADGPVALCEVQGYAYEAAVHAADLLDHFGHDGGSDWRAWAAALAVRFRERFWVNNHGRRFPALALDGEKRQVDSLTSNIGHLLGTGLLNAEETTLVAELLGTPAMSSGFGLRTMSTDDAGFSALSYHCGSVWAHDTAIAIHGLTRSGHGRQSFGLIEGLLAAGVAFDYRLPELYSGDSRADTNRPMPYPAACRPQAWAAAAIGPIIQALAGLCVERAPGRLVSDPPPGSPFGAITVAGLRLGTASLAVTIDRAGVGTLG
jgi:glycogen debranching enzyme